MPNKEQTEEEKCEKTNFWYFLEIWERILIINKQLIKHEKFFFNFILWIYIKFSIIMIKMTILRSSDYNNRGCHLPRVYFMQGTVVRVP